MNKESLTASKCKPEGKWKSKELPCNFNYSQVQRWGRGLAHPVKYTHTRNVTERLDNQLDRMIDDAGFGLDSPEFHSQHCHCPFGGSLRFTEPRHFPLKVKGSCLNRMRLS